MSNLARFVGTILVPAKSYALVFSLFVLLSPQSGRSDETPPPAAPRGLAFELVSDSSKRLAFNKPMLTLQLNGPGRLTDSSGLQIDSKNWKYVFDQSEEDIKADAAIRIVIDVTSDSKNTVFLLADTAERLKKVFPEKRHGVVFFRYSLSDLKKNAMP